MTHTPKRCRSGERCTPTSLKEALDCLGHHGALTVRELAERIGHVSEGTLGKQLSLCDEDNYPTLRQVVPLTLASRNDALINYLAVAVGGVFTRLPATGATGAQLATSVKEYGEMLQIHAAMLADGQVTPAEFDRFRHEAMEAMAAIQALVLALEATVVHAPEWRSV